MHFSVHAYLVSLRRAAALALAVPILVATATPGRAQPSRFGDSTWVAPYDVEGAQPVTADGPRVGEPDRARTWETILRAPFRIAFLPLRVVALGATEAAGFFTPRLTPPLVYKVHPIFSYTSTSGPTAGVGVRYPDWLGINSTLSLQGTYSLNDHRRLRLRYERNQSGGSRDVVATGSDEKKLRPQVGGGVEIVYDFRPNRRFYGIGNFSDKDQKSIYLEEEGRAQGLLRVGRDARRQIHLLAGVSDLSARRGYDSEPRAEDVFSPAAVPYLGRSSTIAFYGAGADLAMVDHLVDPSLGLHLRGEVRQVDGLNDEGALKYLLWHTEARGYLPVFAKRRVLGLRLVHQWAEPADDSGPLPFYRLPSSSDELRFAAYKNGRFRDQHIAVARLEYRWIVWERIWFAGIAELGEVASESDRLRIADAHESYGVGLRFAPSDTKVLRLEAAKGSEGFAIHLDLKGDF